jgi:lipoprotein-anchoring transpeptidase ErfK/SrfK
MTIPLVIACALALGQAGAVSTDQALLDMLRLQVMLDRAGFSPGAIDGRDGPSTRKALEAYRRQAGDPEQRSIEPLTRYQITAADVAGPFVPDIPADLVEQAKLPHLGYRSVVEALAERFHTTPRLLQRLNRKARFAEGEEILVPHVEPFVPPADEPKRAHASGAAGATGTSGEAKADVIVTVGKSESALIVTDVSGRVLMYAPVTTGSENDPLPIGEWKVTGVSRRPTFHYNPKLFWDADPSHAKAKILPGPNNPVGLVWIDLSKEHYGIHGTPEPTQIGRSESHGCVRLTNWDAVKLADLVGPGTRVVFTE